MRSIFAFIFVALVPLFISPATATAQFENGSIVGTVRDSSGAVIPDATVKVTNLATGVVSTRSSNGDGEFEVPALRVGQYNVLAAKAGFATATATNIGVTISGRQRVDLNLSAGEAETTVNVVSGVSLQPETDTSERGQIVTQQQIAALPLVSRNYSDLIGLTTGVRQATGTLTSTSNTGLVREGAFNVNGQRSIFNNFLLDGMDNNAYGESNQGFSNQIIQPAPDAIAQFQVVTNNQGAEYGRASGATINVAFMQGTNTFHGRVYEFLRNTDLNATGFFRPPGGRKPQFNRNQFGGNIGGPIKRDKLFFFVDYEGFRQARKQVSTATLPTNNQRAGVFGTTVYDPYTGKAYAAGTSILTAADISPIAKTIVGLLPADTSTAAANNFTTFQRSQNYQDKGDVRLDYTLNSRNSFFVRVSELKQNATDFPIFGLPIDGNSNGKQRILDQQVAVGYTRVVGANQLLDARLGLSRTKAGKFSLSIGDNPGFTFAGLPTAPAVAGGIPGISITGIAALGRQTTNPQFQNPALLDPKVNYTWVLGSHSLKFGYEYQHIWMAVQDTNPLYGSFTFAGGYSRPVVGGRLTGTATTDNYVADFLWGASSAYSLSSYFVAHLRNQSHFGYVQDDWKATPRLTLNLGLRYEYTTPYYEQKNLQSNFNPAAAESANLQSFIYAKQGNKYTINPDKNDFAPRVGFAYAADDKTALRGGYGISFSHYDRAGSGNILAINPPQALFVTVTQAPTGAAKSPTYTRMDQGFPATTLTFNPKTDNITYIDSNRYRDSYVHSYYLDVQRTLAKNTLLDIAYVGNFGLKLLQIANYNQGDPLNGFQRPVSNFGDITYPIREAYSHYDSLQVRYEQRMVAGLTLLNSFTYSHALDNAGASLEANTPSPQDIRNLAGDYGQSEYNQPLINTTSLVYDLPFGQNRRFMNTGGVLNQVLGQWQVSAVNEAESGFPFNLTYNPPTSNQVSGIAASYRGANLYRPNRVAGVPLTTFKKSLSNGTALQYVNINTATRPTGGATTIPVSVVGGILQSPFGNLSRDPGRSPLFNTLNLSFNKRFDLPVETLKLEFRGELYNSLNRSNFAPPSTTTIANSTATVNGVSTPIQTGGAITSTFDPRIVQFGLKVLF